MNARSLTISLIFCSSFSQAFAATNTCTGMIDNMRAAQCPLSGAGIVLKDPTQFCERTSLEEIQRGNTLMFLAMLKNINSLSAEEYKILKTIAPLTAFNDESRENNVQVPNFYQNRLEDMIQDNPGVGRFKVVITKSFYLMPGVSSKDISPELMASTAYQEGCQPGYPKKTAVLAVDGQRHPNTFRISKEIFRVLLVPLKIIVQMKASEITDAETLKRLSNLEEGFSVSKAILMERTKENISKVDGSKVVKSLQLYHDVEGGVLVANYTIVMNDQLPGGFSAFLSFFGAKNAADESAETANRTRAYLRNR